MYLPFPHLTSEGCSGLFNFLPGREQRILKFKYFCAVKTSQKKNRVKYSKFEICALLQEVYLSFGAVTV